MSAHLPSASTQFSAFLSRFPPEIIVLAKQCMPKLRRAFAGANQLVYDYSHSLVVGFGMSERGDEAIVAISIDPRWVRLYFDRTIPDPKGLLEGTGAKVRSVIVKVASDLDRGDIKDLIDAAIKHSGITFSPDIPNRMIIKSESKKKSGLNKKPKPRKQNPRKIVRAENAPKRRVPVTA